jgi:hypothetical protein
MVGGFLAALMLPSGVEEKVMFAVAPVVAAERAGGRPGDRSDEAADDGLEGAGGDVGEGEPKGVSESTSTSGVVTGESIVEEVIVSLQRPLVLRGQEWERRGREGIGIGTGGSRAGREVRCTCAPRSWLLATIAADGGMVER